jgi:hypothetical protein
MEQDQQEHQVELEQEEEEETHYLPSTILLLVYGTGTLSLDGPDSNLIHLSPLSLHSRQAYGTSPQLFDTHIPAQFSIA